MKDNYVNQFLDAGEKGKEILILNFLIHYIEEKQERIGSYNKDRYQQYYYSRAWEYLSQKLRKVKASPDSRTRKISKEPSEANPSS